MEPDPEMSQEDQARLLVEPSFTNRLDDEDALLEAEFGPPDAAGYYGRRPGPESSEPGPVSDPESDPDPEGAS